MRTLISLIALNVALYIIPSVASASTSTNDTRALKKTKKEIAAIQARYYQQKASEVLGDDNAPRNYYVKVNTSLPVVSMKSLNKIRTSGRKFSGAQHSRSQFSQGGCDNAVKGICTAH